MKTSQPRTSIWFLAAALIIHSGCQTQHTITLRPDRSAFIRNSTTYAGKDKVRDYYTSPTVVTVDTSGFNLIESIVLISEIDSLGYYLPTFDPRQISVALQGKELSFRFNQAPLLSGWSGSTITLFVEQGIEKALPAKRRVKLDWNYATIRIPRKVLKRSPSDLDFTLLLR
jgi:hypothetical protein